MARGGFLYIGGTDQETYGRPVLRIYAAIHDPAWFGMPDDWDGEGFDPLPPTEGEIQQFRAQFPVFDATEATAWLWRVHNATDQAARAATWHEIAELAEEISLAMEANDPDGDDDEWECLMDVLHGCEGEPD